MAVYLTNSFEGGTSGTTISTSNSGGNSGSAFNVVTIGASATLEYSNVQAAHGSLSAQFVNPSSLVANIIEWSTSLTGSSLPQVWFRAYCYMPSYPGGFRIVEFFDGSTLCGVVEFAASGSNGIIKCLDSTGTAQVTGSLSLPKNAWFRIEGYCIGSATAGQVSCSVYTSMDSTTPSETDTTAATINTTGQITNIRFGNPSSAASYTFYVDDLGASDTGPLGPALMTGSSAIAGTSALADTGYKTGLSPSLLAGTGTFANTGTKTATSPAGLAAGDALTGQGVRRSVATGLIEAAGLLAAAGTKAGTGPSLVTATGVLTAVTATPAASGIAAAGSLRGTGLKNVAGASAVSGSGGLRAFPVPHSAAFTTGYPRSRWAAGSPQTRWQAGYPLMRWPAGQ